MGLQGEEETRIHDMHCDGVLHLSASEAKEWGRETLGIASAAEFQRELV
jgi:hypothetical protein